MRLTEAQKQLIVLYRKQNMGYGEIAKKMGLLKTTVTAYCHRHQLDGFRGGTASSVQNEQIQTPSCTPQQSVETKETPTVTKGKRGKKEIHATVTYVFAKEPNYEVAEEVKRILLGANRRTETDPTTKSKNDSRRNR